MHTVNIGAMLSSTILFNTLFLWEYNFRNGPVWSFSLEINLGNSHALVY